MSDEINNRKSIKHDKIDMLFKRFSHLLVIDEATGLPYGLGTDKFIEEQRVGKVENRKSLSQDIQNLMGDLLSSLQYYKVDDIVHLHRYVIARSL